MTLRIAFLCLLLFAIYDDEGVTRRIDDVRVITQKGRDVLDAGC